MQSTGRLVRHSGEEADLFATPQSEPEQNMERITQWDSVDDWIQVAGRNTLSTEKAVNAVVISDNDFES